jgi:hypothetical protein
MCVPLWPPSLSFVVQLTNQSLLGFEAQTKKLSRWFWGLNHQTRAASFEDQTGNPPPPWFWVSTKKPTTGFEAKLGETVPTSFEATLEKTAAASFEAKPLETIATGFESKSVKTVRVVLMPNHSQTFDLCFEAQPRNPRS